MADGNPEHKAELIAATAEIVAAYVAKNSVSDLQALMRQVYQTLESLSGEESGARAAVAREPAVPVKQSVMPDYIVCLEDGKKMKMLKRYLKTTYDMTPEQYRAKWNLPHDYPMTAPNYAKKRSSLAKASGLGRDNSKPKE